MSARYRGPKPEPDSSNPDGALDTLYADRILHGVRALEDPRLIARLAEIGACLDVRPAGNPLL